MEEPAESAKIVCEMPLVRYQANAMVDHPGWIVREPYWILSDHDDACPSTVQIKPC